MTYPTIHVYQFHYRKVGVYWVFISCVCFPDVVLIHIVPIAPTNGQVSLTATVTCNQYYLLSCGADGAR